MGIEHMSGKIIWGKIIRKPGANLPGVKPADNLHEQFNINWDLESMFWIM